MRIAIIGTRGIPPNYGGSETYVEQLALRLAARGDEVWVYGAPLPTSPELHELAANYPTSIHRVEIPSPRSKHADNFVRSLLASIHVCSLRNVEIVQFVNVGPAVFGVLPRLFGKKVVGAIRAMDSRREKWGPLARLYLRVCERLVHVISHAATANSMSIVNYYRERYGAEIHFTPNGVNFPDQIPFPLEILHWGLRKHGYILFVARLVPEKGCHTLLEAFRSITWPGMRLVIAGGESFAPEYVRDLKRMANDSVLFVGHVNGRKLNELYANAYAFVLPSAVEGMSNSLLSAMAFGCPVVVSDIPENVVVVEGAPIDPTSGEATALTFRLGDPMDLAEKLRILQEDPQMAQRCGMYLRNYAKRTFSWMDSADITRRIYESLLRQ